MPDGKVTESGLTRWSQSGADYERRKWDSNPRCLATQRFSGGTAGFARSPAGSRIVPSSRAHVVALSQTVSAIPTHSRSL